MNQPNTQDSYLRSDSILLVVTAVLVIVAMIALHYVDKRTGFIERLIVIPEPSTHQSPVPSTTP